MTICYKEKGIEKELEVRNFKVLLSDSCEIRISINNFNQLVLNKQVFDDSDGTIMILPSVSNEIRVK